MFYVIVIKFLKMFWVKAVYFAIYKKSNIEFQIRVYPLKPSKTSS